MKPTEVFITIMIIVAVTGYSAAHPVESPVSVDSVHASDVVEATSSATIKEVHYEPIEEYIRLTFGVYADKAMLLLKGDGTKGACAENRNLDPKAFNRNWSKTEGVYWSTDWNIFQINDSFHPVKELHLDTDWKANIDYSFRMFEHDGYTFSKRWTCGKWYKSLGYDI